MYTAIIQFESPAYHALRSYDDTSVFQLIRARASDVRVN